MEAHHFEANKHIANGDVNAVESLEKQVGWLRYSFSFARTDSIGSFSKWHKGNTMMLPILCAGGIEKRIKLQTGIMHFEDVQQLNIYPDLEKSRLCHRAIAYLTHS